MDIFILRHGKAEDNFSGISSDSKRKLTVTGKNEMIEIADGLNHLDFSFDYVYSSPLVRAKETAEIIVKHMSGKKKKIILQNDLKPESDVSSISEKLIVLSPDSKILLVGHEPHLSCFVSSIISNQSDVSINLKKGGFVHIRVHVSNSKLIGTLRCLLTPKQLKLCK